MPEVNDHDQSVGDVVAGWKPRSAPAAISLIGRHVALLPLTTDHAGDLFATLCGPDDTSLWTYRPTDPPVDLAGMRGLVAAHLEVPAIRTYTVVPTGGVPSGMVSLMRIEPDHGQVEVAGVLYARHLQRTPASTETTHLLMKYAFEGLGYRRFEWKCDSLNEPSRRAAVRLGFTYEGRFRQHMVTKGRNRDTDWYSVTDSEWPALRDAHRRWLDPANFDEQGRQRVSLSSLTG